MEEELQCIICLSTLRDPVTFSCQSHSLCKEPCLRQLYNKQQQQAGALNNNSHTHNKEAVLVEQRVKIQCPVCGPANILELTSISEAEINKALARIIALHFKDCVVPKSPLLLHVTSGSSCTPNGPPPPSGSGGGSSPALISIPIGTTPSGAKNGSGSVIMMSNNDVSPPIVCEVCKKAAQVECLACGCALCDKHDASIHMAGILKQHPRVAIVVQARNSRFCDVHRGRLLEFVCLQDSSLVCSNCLLTGPHVGHPYSGIEEAITSQKNKLSESKRVLEGRLMEKHEILEKIGKARNSVHRQKTTTQEIVDAKMDEILLYLHRKRELLKREVDDIETEKLTQLNAYADATKNEIFLLESGISNVTETLSIADTHDHFALIAKAVSLDKTVPDLASQISASGNFSDESLSRILNFQISVDCAGPISAIGNLNLMRNFEQTPAKLVLDVVATPTPSTSPSTAPSRRLEAESFNLDYIFPKAPLKAASRPVSSFGGGGVSHTSSSHTSSHTPQASSRPIRSGTALPRNLQPLLEKAALGKDEEVSEQKGPVPNNFNLFADDISGSSPIFPPHISAPSDSLNSILSPPKSTSTPHDTTTHHVVKRPILIEIPHSDKKRPIQSQPPQLHNERVNPHFLNQAKSPNFRPIRLDLQDFSLNAYGSLQSGDDDVIPPRPRSVTPPRATPASQSSLLQRGVSRDDAVLGRKSPSKMSAGGSNRGSKSTTSSKNLSSSDPIQSSQHKERTELLSSSFGFPKEKYYTVPQRSGGASSPDRRLPSDLIPTIRSSPQMSSTSPSPLSHPKEASLPVSSLPPLSSSPSTSSSLCATSSYTSSPSSMMASTVPVLAKGSVASHARKSVFGHMIPEATFTLPETK